MSGNFNVDLTATAAVFLFIYDPFGSLQELRSESSLRTAEALLTAAQNRETMIFEAVTEKLKSMPPSASKGGSGVDVICGPGNHRARVLAINEYLLGHTTPRPGSGA